MSAYGDDYGERQPRSRDDNPRPPYPTPSQAPGDDYGRQPRQPYYDNDNLPPPPPGPPPGAGGTNVPPPPMGEQLHRRPSAMKREGSRGRVPNLHPEFPDQASYLGSTAPDLEAKNRAQHRRFRDMRDGYESDEGETLRKNKTPRGPPGGGPPDAGAGVDPRQRPPRDPYDDRGPPPPYDGSGRGPPPRSRTYDDDRAPPRRRDRDRDYDDDLPPPRRRKDRDYDDDPPPPRRRRDPPDVEYGSEPIPVRRSRSERQLQRPKPSRRDDYDDDDDDDRRRPAPTRHRSQDDAQRRRRRDDDDGGRDYRDDPRRRNDRDRDDRRRAKSRDRDRRRYSDEESDYGDRRDRRDRRDRDRDRDRRSKPPSQMKIGDYDVGPLLDKGKRNWGTLAPVVTPIVMNMAKKYLSK